MREEFMRRAIAAARHGWGDTHPNPLVGALVVVVGIYLLVALAGVGSQPLEEFSSEEQQNAGMPFTFAMA